MAAFDPTEIDVGPGTLYAAPLGTTEPTAVTGAWPAGWVALGYTTGGTSDSFAPTFAPITVEEELDPVTNIATGRVVTVSFALAQITARNLLLAYNAGIGSSLYAGASGFNADGSMWVEPVPFGSETRVMIGWDAIPKAGTTTALPNNMQRKIYRKCLQTGAITGSHKKGNAMNTINNVFTLEVPSGGLALVRTIFDPFEQS